MADLFPEFFENESTDEAFVREDLAPDWDAALAWYQNEACSDSEYTQAVDSPLCPMRWGRRDELPEGVDDQGLGFFIRCEDDEADVRYWWLLP